MKVLAAILLSISLTPTHATDTIDQRFRNLTKEIRCVVCQNQSIADSNAPLAKDLRKKVHQMLLEKKSDADIKAYLVKRYGEFILLQPRLQTTTFFLWTFPVLSLLIAGFMIFRFIK